MNYIACADPDGEIYHFGKGTTPDEAYENFMSTQFIEHCIYREIDEGDVVDVCVFEEILVAEMTQEERDSVWIDDDWTFFCSTEVMRKSITFKGDE